MITIIILTGLAILVLIIGFFDIRIPFIHIDSATRNRHHSLKQKRPGKENFKVKTTERTIKNFFQVQ